MITPMTKLSILIYHRDYQSFLEKLRQHGVVHVHPKKTSLQDERYRTKLNSIKQVSNLIKQLEKLPAAQNPVDTELRNEALYNFIDDKFKEIESLQQQLLYLQKEDSVYGLWGKYPEKYWMILKPITGIYAFLLFRQENMTTNGKKISMPLL